MFLLVYGASPTRRVLYRWVLPIGFVVGILIVRLVFGEQAAIDRSVVGPDLLWPLTFLSGILALVWGSEWMLRRKLARHPGSVLVVRR